MTGREVRMTDDRTNIAEMPIRIQSLAKDMRTVVLTMTGWVVLGDDVVDRGLTVCAKLDSHTVPAVGDHAVCKSLDSHTEPVVRSLVVCKSLDPHTDDVVV